MSHIMRRGLLLAFLFAGCAFPQTRMEPITPAASPPPPTQPTATEVAQKKPTRIR
jgi:hypothetical protein